MDRGKFIQDKMAEYGYSIDMIASMLDVNPSTIWRWFKAKPMPLVKMKLIADLLKLDLRENFPEAEILYSSGPKNYEALYLKELERNRILQEEVAVYKAKATNVSGQNRD